MIICRHILVSGKVQGVFYRDSTYQQAQIFGLTGYVKNLENGNVEIQVCGEASKLDEFVIWLWKGPILADVTGIHSKEIPLVDYAAFSIE